MNAGRTAPAMRTRGLSQPPRRGASLVATASTSPAIVNIRRSDSGTSQTKWRLIM